VSRLKDLIGPPTNSGPVAHRGIVATDAASMDSRVMVIVPGFDEQLQIGPCRWQSRDASTKPVRGTPCLVIFDDIDEPWIAAWWPYET
jgi:hypothetical protein